MYWDIDITKTIIRQGEDFAIDIRLYDNTSNPVDISTTDVELQIWNGTTIIDRASTIVMPGQLLLNRPSETNRVFVNIPSLKTKNYPIGQLRIVIELDNLVFPFDILNVISSKMTPLL